MRFHQDHSGAQPVVERAAEAMKAMFSSAENTSHIDKLRGYEGACAQEYWRAFGRMFKTDDIEFTLRRYHPSPDPVNAILSFGYALLTSELHSLLDAIGFDPFLGFFHVESYGRPSLALDLIEPFRAPVIDRMAVRLFNLRILKSHDFEDDGEGGMQLRRLACRTFFREYERQLQKLKTREHIREQLEQLRRVFLGEADSLEPFMWRART